MVDTILSILDIVETKSAQRVRARILTIPNCSAWKWRAFCVSYEETQVWRVTIQKGERVDFSRRASYCTTQRILLLRRGCLRYVRVLYHNHCCFVYMCNPLVLCDLCLSQRVRKIPSRRFWLVFADLLPCELSQWWYQSSNHALKLVNPIDWFDRLHGNSHFKGQCSLFLVYDVIFFSFLSQFLVGGSPLWLFCTYLYITGKMNFSFLLIHSISYIVSSKLIQPSLVIID